MRVQKMSALGWSASTTSSFERALIHPSPSFGTTHSNRDIVRVRSVDQGNAFIGRGDRGADLYEIVSQRIIDHDMEGRLTTDRMSDQSSAAA